MAFPPAFVNSFVSISYYILVGWTDFSLSIIITRHSYHSFCWKHTQCKTNIRKKHQQQQQQHIVLPFLYSRFERFITIPSNYKFDDISRLLSLLFLPQIIYLSFSRWLIEKWMFIIVCLHGFDGGDKYNINQYG